jgi:OOP family OmpA-OmpF porin
MNKLRLKTLMTVVVSSAFTIGVAAAQDTAGPGPGYLGDPSKHYVRDSSGRCVYTSEWSKEVATKECNPELFPEPMAEPAAPPPPPAPVQPVYENVTLSATALFAFDKAVVTDEGKAAINALADDIKSKGASVVDLDIIGYTDSTGPEAYNEQLSLRRATAVKDYIVTQGIDPGIIDVSGKGESDPVASNATREGRAKNRRVEVHIGVKEQVK